MPDATAGPGAGKPSQPAREPYETPVLRVFGSLTDLTCSVGKKGQADGGRGNMRRSNP